ncbi:aldo/keto reductase [Piscinibacter sp.]|uniref:aldo/keto reductase n=1 Tax=Piscinibacter sp. TaxID=1903157 RepID=UPI002BEA30F9|nr:aldo/keto reductase [Albitalea sp.]HUG22784.1 aldo/keto reductase [Albitalea sp.]
MDRRRILALAPAASLAAMGVRAQSAAALRRPIGRGGDSLPVIGLGTWLTFDVGSEAAEQAPRREVLRRFFAAGGGMIDSSPMYGNAEWLLGQLLPDLPHAGRLWAASKVWTPLGALGPGQLDRSLALWRVPRFDVLLVHNLLNWRAHLRTLRQWKDDGRVRWIGVSTSHGRSNDEAARLVRDESLDVLQITYNLVDPSAEAAMNRAAERGAAVVINRPFDGGALFNRVSRKPLPAWASSEAGCANWAQFFLKWIVGHPAVTCAIPATRDPAHLDENMGAGRGRLPDEAMRRRMQATFASLA